MNFKRLPVLFVSVFVAAACGNYVVTGGGPDNLHGNGGNGSTGGGMNYPAVALTRAQLDVLWEEYWGNQGSTSGVTTTSGGGSELNPDDLFLRVSDLGTSCGSPTTDLSCGGHWELSIAVPPALQQVGVYDLASPELSAYSFMSETGELYSPSGSPEDCSYGGGSIVVPGTLEILSIDDTEVHFRVDLMDGFYTSNPSGEYTAPRCAVAP